jgi:hypothetical protein
MRELLGVVRTDTVFGTTLSSLVTSQAMWPPMLQRSPATPGMVAVPVLHVHAPSQLKGARSSLSKLRLSKDTIASPTIDLNRTPTPIDSRQAMRKGSRDALPTIALHVYVLFNEMPTSTPTDSV